MPIVSSTATVTIEPQNLSNLKATSPFLHKKKKIDRRDRYENAFRHVILRMPGKKTVFLIYASGKCVILGAKSREEAAEASKWLQATLKTSVKGKMKIKNFVYTFDAGVAPICLQSLFVYIRRQQRERGFGNFDPEISPALHYRSAFNPKANVMIFRTGKVTLTGVHDELMGELIVGEVKQILYDHSLIDPKELLKTKEDPAVDWLLARRLRRQRQCS